MQRLILIECLYILAGKETLFAGKKTSRVICPSRVWVPSTVVVAGSFYVDYLKSIAQNKMRRLCNFKTLLFEFYNLMGSIWMQSIQDWDILVMPVCNTLSMSYRCTYRYTGKYSLATSSAWHVRWYEGSLCLTMTATTAKFFHASFH